MDRIEKNARAIFSDNGADTMARLSRTLYKYTAAGITISFKLRDGSCVWVGNESARMPEPWRHVAAVGVSSIVEGCDAEVPLEWLELEEFESPADAIRAFDDLCESVDDEACALFDEYHNGEY